MILIFKNDKMCKPVADLIMRWQPAAVCKDTMGAKYHCPFWAFQGVSGRKKA